MEKTRYDLNKELAQMLKGGVIMDVTTPEQAKIAEAAGACAVMALERIPADIRAAGGVSRMSDPTEGDSWQYFFPNSSRETHRQTIRLTPFLAQVHRLYDLCLVLYDCKILTINDLVSKWCGAGNKLPALHAALIAYTLVFGDGDGFLLG